MRYLLTLCWLTSQLFAQVSVTVTGTTPTQAVVQLRGYSGSCTLNLREHTSTGTLHPDVTASADILRPDTITWADGTRTVTIGHQRSNLALAADTGYYLTVSDCGDATAVFRTGVPALGNTFARTLPWSASTWTNVDYPVIDWANTTKSYVDPVTGVRMRPLNLNTGLTWRSAATAFHTYAGGTNWTSPANAVTYSPRATVSSTDYLDLLVVPTDGAMHNWTIPASRMIHDLAIVANGSGTSANAADRQIAVCVVHSPADGCKGTPVTITLPQTTPNYATGGTWSNPSEFPASFPSDRFAGWGNGAELTVDKMGWTFSGATATNGILTISSANGANFFPEGMKAGSYIRVTGTNPVCPHDVCTVQSYVNGGQILLNEPINGSGLSGWTYPWAIRIQKTTANGSISAGFRWKSAGAQNSGVVAEGIPCHPKEIRTGDGVTGHSCFPTVGGSAGYRAMYFVPNDLARYAPRFISNFVIPHNTQIFAMPLADRPATGTKKGDFPFGFDKTNSSVYYTSVLTQAGKPAIYRLTYTGNWSALNYNYATYTSDPPQAPSDNFVWENVLQASQNKDIGFQVTALYPGIYNKTLWGSWDSASFVGMSGDTAIFMKAGTQDGGIAWYAVINMTNGKLVDLFNSLTGSARIPALRWGNQHSSWMSNFPSDTLGLSMRILDVGSGNTNRMWGGPWEATPGYLLRNGSWSADTSLPWPAGSSYEQQCPADIGENYKKFGAVGNQCATLRFPGWPCNTQPTAEERASFPACRWNSAYTEVVPFRPGDMIGDPTSVGTRVQFGDSERLLVLKVTNMAGGSDVSSGDVIVVVQRNASWNYCCAGASDKRANSTCANLDPRMQHTDGWKARMTAGSFNSCHGNSLLVNYNHQTSTVTPVELFRDLGAGHYGMGQGMSGDGYVDFISAIATKRNASFADLGKIPFNDSFAMKMTLPRFDGIDTAIGTSRQQQYLQRGFANVPWAVDANALNGYTGYTPNTIYASLGARTLTKISGNVWKIQVLGTVNYKRSPLIVFAGRHYHKDVSGPASDISAAPAYSFCHALSDNECRPGAVRGETYINTPNVYNNPNCVTGMIPLVIPCAVTGFPAAGAIRQYRIDQPDVVGDSSRVLTYAWGFPGLAPSFFGAYVTPSGSAVLNALGEPVDGTRYATLAFQLPAWRNTQPKNTPGGLRISVGSRPGVTHARVRFGYDTAFHCSERNEACLTDTAIAPYAFAGEPLSPTPCATGCSVDIPAVAGRVVYYRIEWVTNGRVNYSSPVLVAAIP